jgi:hypothetical protein
MIRGRLAILIAILMALLIVKTVYGQVAQAPPEAKQFTKKWEGKPLAFPPVPMDLDRDGVADIVAFFIDDPATKIVGDAVGFTSLDYRLWAFVESCGYDCGKIVWMDPAAPEAWRDWLVNALAEGNKKRKSPAAPPVREQI